jgi:hypothetical protein
LTEGKLIDEVSGEEMADVEVGDGAKTLGIEAVGDVAEAASASSELTGAFGVGSA